MILIKAALTVLHIYTQQFLLTLCRYNENNVREIL
jgi:hypothetical protein